MQIVYKKGIEIDDACPSRVWKRACQDNTKDIKNIEWKRKPISINAWWERYVLGYIISWEVIIASRIVRYSKD